MKKYPIFRKGDVVVSAWKGDGGKGRGWHPWSHVPEEIQKGVVTSSMGDNDRSDLIRVLRNGTKTIETYGKSFFVKEKQ